MSSTLPLPAIEIDSSKTYPLILVMREVGLRRWGGFPLSKGETIMLASGKHDEPVHLAIPERAIRKADCIIPAGSFEPAFFSATADPLPLFRYSGGLPLTGQLKTYDKWNGDLSEYLEVGDRVDEPIVDHFVSVMPPACNGAVIQMGEPSSHDNKGRAHFLTLQRCGPHWIFTGVRPYNQLANF